MKKLLAAGGVIAVAVAALTGCSGGGGAAASCQNKIVNSDAKQVTMWAWYPNFEPVVDLFNKNHKDVQICWTNTGAGNDEYTKFSTAIQAGSGAPDVVMLESEVVPSYVADGSIVNLSKLVITGALISIIPLIVSFLTLQRYWQGGLAIGSVK